MPGIIERKQMNFSTELWQTAYLSLGSNLGRPKDNCLNAIERLERHAEVRIQAKSPFYLTEPVDYLEQEWFVNGALKIETRLTAHQLLVVTRSIQNELGRKTTSIRFGPRIIDIDIIFFGNQIISVPDLIVPHPRMHKRRFVLKPICDIDPNVVHPLLDETVRDLLEKLDPGKQRMVPA